MKNYTYFMIIPIKHTNIKGTYYFVSTYMLFIKHVQTYTIKDSSYTLGKWKKG